ncbi:ankyrin repeat and zinc finger domain-containing protein 1-like, partial [Thalictrum thalictroides]
AEKDAKRKAKAKELKKVRKAKEKAQAQAALAKNVPTVSHNQRAAPVSVIKAQATSSSGVRLSKEEELKRAQDLEREKRAAAAEKRIAAAAALNSQRISNSEPATGAADDISCSCCNASLAGKVPFHRYHYKYCSTSCMHVHKEMVEDG